MKNEEKSVEIISLMKKCISGIEKFLAPDDILNIGNGMAFELAQYEEYSEKADSLLEGDDHPQAISDRVHDAICESIKEHPVLERAKDLPSIASAAALKSTVSDYAKSVIDLVREDDHEVIDSISSSFVDTLRMTVGSNIEAMNDDDVNQYGKCAKDIERLSDIVFSGMFVDMMGEDYDDPPESLDRGFNEVSNEEHELSHSSVGGNDMETARVIISRISMNGEDRKELMAMTEEIDDDGNPKYTTSYLVNEANKRIQE